MKREEDKPMKRKTAVAMRYDAALDHAPRVVAKGRGVLAEQILAIAREHGVHIYEDPDFVELLAALDVNAQLPEELYRAAAEILAFVYRLNKYAAEDH